MRNVTQFAVSLVLLATQVHIPLVGEGTATADARPVAVYEVKLNTNTASPVEIVGNQPDYDSEVLGPLHAAQAAAAAKRRSVPVRRKVVVSKPVVYPGTHTDWMRAAGIAESDYGYVDYIISRESGWVASKYNYGGSGAYGLGQALPASKMAPFGADYLTNPVTQLKWANAYATSRYGSWAGAYAHWLARHSW